MDRYTFTSMGSFLCIGMSVVGASWYAFHICVKSSFVVCVFREFVVFFFLCIHVLKLSFVCVCVRDRGILLIGSSLMGAAIRVPRIWSLNLISVIFCEAVALYGVIIAIILSQKVREREKTNRHPHHVHDALRVVE